MEKHLWIVEGIHDASLLQKFLTLKGFRLQRKASSIESYWDKLIPKTFLYFYVFFVGLTILVK